MKPLPARLTHLVFWALFACGGAVLLWRFLGNPIPAFLVLVLALLMGALGLYVFVHNMRDARDAWNQALSPGQVEKKESEREA
jgi:uncharacterized membrane protein